MLCFCSIQINLISKDINVVFHLSCIIRRSNGEKTKKQMKADAILFELADVANVL